MAFVATSKAEDSKADEDSEEATVIGDQAQVGGPEVALEAATKATPEALRAAGRGVQTLSTEECHRCDETIPINAVCSRGYHPFHRIVDCLLPLLPVLAAGVNATSKAASAEGGGLVCLSDLPRSWGLDAFIAALHPASRHKLRLIESDLFSRNASCSKLLRNQTAAGRAAPLLRLFSRTPAASVTHLLRADVLQAVESASLQQVAGHTLFISRHVHAVGHAKISAHRGMPIRNEEMMKAHLGHALKLPVLTYAGDESALQTVALFSRAVAIVGIHGAGLVNAVFATAPTCVVEITLLMRDDSDPACSGAANLRGSAGTAPPPNGSSPRTPKLASFELWNRSTTQGAFQPWRSNRDAVVPWNPLISWHTHYLSVTQQLAFNGLGCANFYGAKSSSRDLYLKQIPLLVLQNHDAMNVATLLTECLPSHKKKAYNSQVNGLHQPLYASVV
jgi:hypothetical protein